MSTKPPTQLSNFERLKRILLLASPQEFRELIPIVREYDEYKINSEEMLDRAEKVCKEAQRGHIL